MKKKAGLYLQGGGAKGAFQAGALQAFAEKGMEFSVIVGTSIGAINGMAVFYGGIERMAEIWKQMSQSEYGLDRTVPVFESMAAVEEIQKLLGTKRLPAVEHFYVNYLPVENGTIRHAFSDLVTESDDKVREYVRASSLLPNPYSWKAADFKAKTYDQLFQEQIATGTYDGYLLDGGLLNNRFMEPFLTAEVDIIYAVALEREFSIPETVRQKYRPDQVILIKPDFDFDKNASMIYTEENIREWSAAGYAQAKKEMTV